MVVHGVCVFAMGWSVRIKIVCGVSWCEFLVSLLLSRYLDLCLLLPKLVVDQLNDAWFSVLRPFWVSLWGSPWFLVSAVGRMTDIQMDQSQFFQETHSF